MTAPLEAPYSASTPAYRTSKPVELSLVDRLRDEAIKQRPLYTRMFHGERIECVTQPLDYGV